MNRKEIWKDGHTYVITRRFLDKALGTMRVRVVKYQGILTRPEYVVTNEFTDYADMHAGDMAYAKIVRSFF